MQDGLNAVLRLLEWAWSTLAENPLSHDSQHLAFVSKSSLILLKTYIQEAYPKQQKLGKKSKDCTELAEAVYHAQTMLRRILSSRRHIFHPPQLVKEKEVSPMAVVVEACCTTFRSCFHAFYPTTPLKWLALCQHLQLVEPVS